jgi:hypothetical protein
MIWKDQDDKEGKDCAIDLDHEESRVYIQVACGPIDRISHRKIAYTLALLGVIGCSLAYFIFTSNLDKMDKKFRLMYLNKVAEAKDYTV